MQLAAFIGDMSTGRHRRFGIYTPWAIVLTIVAGLAFSVPSANWAKEAGWDYVTVNIILGVLQASWIVLLPLHLFEVTKVAGQDQSEGHPGRETRFLQNITLVMVAMAIISIWLTYSYLFWSASQRRMSIVDGGGVAAAHAVALSKGGASYFVASTLSTVGFGDIRAVSGPLRFLVTVELATGVLLLILATGVAITRVAALPLPAPRSLAADPATTATVIMQPVVRILSVATAEDTVTIKRAPILSDLDVGTLWSLSWGDNSSETSVVFPATHRYASPGVYTVTLTSRWSEGVVASVSETVTIH